MPAARLVYYKERDGAVPILEWFGRIPRAAVVKGLAYLGRLETAGHELRRPVADYLRDGVYELRPSAGGVQYRILYFFHGRDVVVVSHGLAKERQVPTSEIDRAIQRMHWFRANPAAHTFEP